MDTHTSAQPPDPSRRFFVFSVLGTAFALGCGRVNAGQETQSKPGVEGLPADPETITPLKLSNDEWKQKLDAQAYNILREEGTERAFTGRYWDNHATGRYLCAGCGLALFASTTKFESGTGWPSFTQPIAANRVRNLTDTRYGMVRVEVRCGRCDGHLGHVFDDGPPPTGKRYCMNSAAMLFEAS